MRLSVRGLRRVCLAIGVGVPAIYVTGKLLLAENMKEKTQLKINGKDAPVPIEVRLLIDEVLEDMKLDEKERSKVIPYMSNTTNLKHISSSLEGFGTYLGIPEYFLIDENRADVIVKVDGKEIPNTTSEYESLKKVMCLSKEAKKFAIAQELYNSAHSDLLYCGFLPIFIVLNCHFLSVALEKISALKKKPPVQRVNFVVYFSGAWLYGLIYDLSCVFKECESDFLASELGESYPRGGKEYYEKMIERHKIIKQLNPKAPFTKDGDINTHLVRVNHMSLPKRLDYLGQISENKEKNIWSYVLS